MSDQPDEQVLAALDRVIKSKVQPSPKAREIATEIISLAFRPMEWQKENSADTAGGKMIDAHTNAMIQRDRALIVARLVADESGAFVAFDDVPHEQLEAWKRGIRWAIAVINGDS